MWQPDLGEREERVGLLHSMWEGLGPFKVIAILDPPKHALPPIAYEAAQHNSAKLFARIPSHEPFVVGLQEDFWKELERQRVPTGGPALAEDYLTRDGLGIVHALSRASPRPEMARLEEPLSFDEYKTLEQSAISVMTETASFFGAIAKGFRSAEREMYSPKLGAFITLAAGYRSGDQKLAAHMPGALAAARVAGVDLSDTAYRSLLLYERLQRLESGQEESAVKAERDLLMRRIELNSSLEHLDRRACWEIFRFSLAKRGPVDEASEARIREIEGFLDGEYVPEPPPEAKAAVAEEVRYALMTDAVRARTGVDKIDLLGGHGEQVSNLLELALALGIDVTPHTILADYVEHAYVHHCLQSLTQGLVAPHVQQALRHLEREVACRLTQTDTDRVLIEFEPTIAFLEALGRYQIVHDEHIRVAIMKLSVTDLCRRLAGLGVDLPARWQDRASAADTMLGTLRDYYDLTVLRGKDLAATLIAAMKARGVSRGVLYCDGYFCDTVSRWFEGRDISYVFATPTW